MTWSVLGGKKTRYVKKSVLLCSYGYYLRSVEVPVTVDVVVVPKWTIAADTHFGGSCCWCLCVECVFQDHGDFGELLEDGCEQCDE